MPDHVVDTNVLLVASAAHPYSPFDDTHVPVAEQRVVFDWLARFREDDERRLVLDDDWRIYEEYRHQLTEQDYGLQVVHEKLQACLRAVPCQWDGGGHAIVPAALQGCDASDRKFVAAALTDPATITIVNATDSDWVHIEDALRAAGVVVEHIVEPWLRGRVRARGHAGERSASRGHEAEA